MTWQAVAALLACARIGAVHSVVFAGFSAEALRDRIIDCKSRVVLTSDEGRRGGKTIATKAIVDTAVKSCPHVEHVLVLKRTGNKVPWTQGRDKWWHEETARVPNYCAPEIMSAEDPLFILYVRYLFVCSCRPTSQLLVDVRLHWQAQGCRTYDSRLHTRCNSDC
jgi:acetyl-CoA synthetase